MIRIDDSYFVRYTYTEDDGTTIRRAGFSDSDPQRLFKTMMRLGMDHLKDVTICRRHFISVETEATIDDLREAGCTDEDIEAMLPYLR